MHEPDTPGALRAQESSRVGFRSAWSSLTRERADACRRLQARWDDAAEIHEGTRGAAYLAHLGVCTPFPRSLRYHPYVWCSALRCRVPALLAAVTPVCRPLELEALCTVWLDPYGVGALRLARTGLFGFSPRGVVALDAFDDELLIGRRLDDALGASAILGMPAIAYMTPHRLERLVLPPSVRRVVIALNAESRSSAAEAFQERQQRRGLTVTIQRPPTGTAFWSAAAREAVHV